MRRSARRSFLGTALLIAVLCFGAAQAIAEAGPSDGWNASELNPNRPAPDGFSSPNFDGPWRFRVAANLWAPNVVKIDADTGRGSAGINENLLWLLKNMAYYVPIDLETRKGSFGVFFHTLFLGLDGNTEVLDNRPIIGPVTLDWSTDLFLLDVGISYELGRWRLCDCEKSPELTLEPYFEARIIHLPTSLSVRNQEVSSDLNSQVPVIGLNVFLDLDEHWNLEFVGDYGGWGVDENHQTWQGVALLGYRWKGWGAHWNLQGGYRAMRLFDMRYPNVDVSMRSRGFDFVLGVEF